MKKTLFISLMIFMLGCSSTPPTETEIYIYFDYTEGQDYAEQMTEDAPIYLQLLQNGAPESPNFGKIKIMPLHDISVARGKSVKLKQGKSELEANKFIREKEVAKFQTKLEAALQTINDQNKDKPLNKSHIYQPICKGMNKLQQSDASRKIIVIYSDLLENSTVANFHKSTKNMDKWTTNFDAACDCGDLSDFEIYVVQPIDKKNDAKIQKGSEFWANYLINKGLDEDGMYIDTGLDL